MEARLLTGRVRRNWVLVLGGWLVIATVSGQAGKAGYVPKLTFDVASVRQEAESNSYTVGGGFAGQTSSLRIFGFNFQNLLALAYGVHWQQIVGVAESTPRFTVQARGDAAADARLAGLDREQALLEQQHMLQVLLGERFKLKTHWETRESPVYDLVIVKGGLRMAEAKGGPPNAEELKYWGGREVPKLYQRGTSDTGFEFVGHRCSMGEIANMLSGQLGQPVVDKTGLTGQYDFTLPYHGTRASDRRAEDTDPVAPLERAIQDQLGLKLIPAKGLEQFLVVDHMEKPSEN